MRVQNWKEGILEVKKKKKKGESCHLVVIETEGSYVQFFFPHF